MLRCSRSLRSWYCGSSQAIRAFGTTITSTSLTSTTKINGSIGLTCRSPSSSADIGTISSGVNPFAVNDSTTQRHNGNFHHRNVSFLLGNRQFSSSAAAAVLEDDDHDDVVNVNSSSFSPVAENIRNVAIVAHVDHGKTTIVDELLKCCAKLNARSSSATEGDDGDESTPMATTTTSTTELVMDNGELERERGITITSKVTRLDFSNEHTINVVDTPGHADFAGEVDRILQMIDGCCLVVDAAEGAMAQTKYVLSRVLSRGITPVVVLNKCDKSDSWQRIESGEVEMELLELFDALGATEEQMDYVTVYSSARSGWSTTDIEVARRLANDGSTNQQMKNNEDHRNDDTISMKVLLDTILTQVPPPRITLEGDNVGEVKNSGDVEENDDNENNKFAMVATTVGYDPYLGRMCTGRIYSGKIQKNDSVVVLPRGYDETTSTTDDTNDSSLGDSSKIAGIFVNRRGLERTLLDPPVAYAGDIVTLAGVPNHMAVGDTLCLETHVFQKAIESLPLAPPTLSMEFGSNTSPFMGREKDTIVASSKVRDRLKEETDNNVTLQVSASETDAEKLTVHARGELQLGILIEQMRREGYELSISPPKIVTKICEESGVELEPIEEVTVDVDGEYAGVVIDKLTGPVRKGVLVSMTEDQGGDKTRLFLEVPTKGLLGFQNEIATLTRGTAVVNHLYKEHRPVVKSSSSGSPSSDQQPGRLVSNDTGKATLYALHSLSDRGTLFIEPGEEVYQGMVIGITNGKQQGDLDVNPVKAKALTNVRAAGKDEKLFLRPPKRMTVEDYIGFMLDDEMLEITPKSVRLRKAELDPGVRARLARAKKKPKKPSK